jgi:hypothetical protein
MGLILVFRVVIVLVPVVSLSNSHVIWTKDPAAADANICLLSPIVFVLLMKTETLLADYSGAGGVRTHKSGNKPAKEWGARCGF